MCFSPLAGMCLSLIPRGRVSPDSSLQPRTPQGATNQHPGMDLHSHDGTIKRLGLDLRSRVGLTHNIALPHFTKAILSSK